MQLLLGHNVFVAAALRYNPCIHLAVVNTVFGKLSSFIAKTRTEH